MRGAGGAGDCGGDARGRSRAESQNLGTDGASFGGGISAEIYIRAGEDVLGAGRGNRGATPAQNRDYQSKPAHAERPGLYRLPATRSWEDYRGGILGAAAGWSAGLGADEVGGTETGA